MVGTVPMVEGIGDVRDLVAYAKRFSENPDDMRDLWNWVGVTGSVTGLVPIVDGPLKGMITGIRRSSLDIVTKKPKYLELIDLSSSKRRTHILDGDETGGGHRVWHWSGKAGVS